MAWLVCVDWLDARGRDRKQPAPTRSPPTRRFHARRSGPRRDTDTLIAMAPCRGADTGDGWDSRPGKASLLMACSLRLGACSDALAATVARCRARAFCRQRRGIRPLASRLRAPRDRCATRPALEDPAAMT